ncbi:cuticle protein 21-like [Athalia rosae]|uniref:cuticle protein 21-like n=1 Tax=Athalia rosae TaxID=37344 RepID=UPI002033400D|nr:cuticle protein 21-like [Athalia rosae]
MAARTPEPRRGGNCIAGPKPAGSSRYATAYGTSTVNARFHGSYKYPRPLPGHSIERNALYSTPINMAAKIVALVALASAASAGLIPGPYDGHISYAAAPIATSKTVDADFDPHPQYSYAYDVQDSLTGDYKEQRETRNGDVVEGSYSLVEADGSRRIVDYTADPENGFNAVIRKEAGFVKGGVAAPVVAAKVAAPLAHSAPVVKLAAYAPAPAPVYAAPAYAPAKIAAPALSYAAPITHVSYSTPLFSYSH